MSFANFWKYFWTNQTSDWLNRDADVCDGQIGRAFEHFEYQHQCVDACKTLSLSLLGGDTQTDESWGTIGAFICFVLFIGVMCFSFILSFNLLLHLPMSGNYPLSPVQRMDFVCYILSLWFRNKVILWHRKDHWNWYSHRHQLWKKKLSHHTFLLKCFFFFFWAPLTCPIWSTGLRSGAPSRWSVPVPSSRLLGTMTLSWTKSL